MTEINAYMNGYSIGDIKFLEASIEAHQDALTESKFETETAKEFLYQHIQTNKELEKKVARLQTKETEFWIPQLERLQAEKDEYKELWEKSQTVITGKNVKIGEHLRKVERLEKILELAYDLPATTPIETLEKWSNFVHQYCTYKEAEAAKG
ncbi:MAG: hypothetical protein ACQET8_17260 [Bacillota bacterium]